MDSGEGSPSNEFSVNQPIKDQDIQNALTNDPDHVVVVFRPNYRFNIISSDEGFAESSRQATANVFEKVFGENSEPKLIVNRQAYQTLVAALKESLTAEFTGTLPDKLVDAVLNTCFDNKRRIDLDTLAKADETLLIYTKGQGRVEITPTDYHKMTSAWKTSDDIKKTFDVAWDQMYKIATQSSDASNYYNSLRNYLKGSGSLSSSASVGMLSDILGDASADANFNLDFTQDCSKLSGVQKQTFSQLQQASKNAGSRKEEFVNKSYKEWYGDDYVAGKEAKDLGLYVVSKTDFEDSMMIHVGEYKKQGVGRKSRPVNLSFGSPDTHWSINEISTKLSSVDKDVNGLRDSNTALTTQVGQQKTSLDLLTLRVSALETSLGTVAQRVTRLDTMVDSVIPQPGQLKIGKVHLFSDGGDLGIEHDDLKCEILIGKDRRNPQNPLLIMGEYANWAGMPNPPNPLPNPWVGWWPK